ncbi:hypothetical protein CTAYLR_007569 [Chrysophaeum taylorii]|uniref:RanBP2-type domain-containing protein n=1 Tax=Chrysophaeum taylorii TaxID=2483200 RepID=A0AAD7XM85_9STRA|nr:hypothetical protein CTAYLR_007569 [Chrysophaeum taylorii]
MSSSGSKNLRDPTSDWIARSRETPDLSNNAIYIGGDASAPPARVHHRREWSEQQGRGRPASRHAIDAGRYGPPGWVDRRSIHDFNADVADAVAGVQPRRPDERPRKVSNRLRSEGDWDCPSCGNVNWSKRTHCNQCGIKKPEASGQCREGRGGGFNERQSQDDYVKRPVNEEDDGFDEFGRKKSSKVDKAARRKAALERLKTQAAAPPRDRSRSRER